MKLSSLVVVLATVAVIASFEVAQSASSKGEIRSHLARHGKAAAARNSVFGAMSAKEEQKKAAAEVVRSIFSEAEKQLSLNLGSNKHLRESSCGRGFGASKCTNCSNNMECCNGSTCCGGGEFCCSNQSTCCTDSCCLGTGINSETCCPDPKHGGTCCEEEQTFCCKPNPDRHLPSRCCPRWYVCCDNGRYGCCDPDTMKPMEENVGYALLLEPSWFGPMMFESAVIDLTAGTMSQKELSGFHTGGETTRTFMFNRETGNFMLLQANFTAPVNKSKGDPDRAVHLYTVNPVEGTIDKLKVEGVVDEITGYHFVESLGKIVASTFSYNSTGHKVGFDYYHIDPNTAAATKVSTSFSANSTIDSFAGWFHEASEDGLIVYRLGYGNVVHSWGYGVETTDLRTNPATVNFTLVPAPVNYTDFKTLNKLPAKKGDAGPRFASLAATENITEFMDFALYTWNLGDVAEGAVKVTQFPNAHRTPQFGPTNTVLNAERTMFAALVVQHSIIGNNGDTYAVATVDLASGNTTEMTLSPILLAETTSVSGFGIPFNATIWQRHL